MKLRQSFQGMLHHKLLNQIFPGIFTKTIVNHDVMVHWHLNFFLRKVFYLWSPFLFHKNLHWRFLNWNFPGYFSKNIPEKEDRAEGKYIVNAVADADVNADAVFRELFAHICPATTAAPCQC